MFRWVLCNKLLAKWAFGPQCKKQEEYHEATGHSGILPETAFCGRRNLIMIPFNASVELGGGSEQADKAHSKRMHCNDYMQDHASIQVISSDTAKVCTIRCSCDFDQCRWRRRMCMSSHAADCTGTKSKRQAVGAVLASSPLQFKGNCGKRWKQFGVHNVLIYLELVNDGQCQTSCSFRSNLLTSPVCWETERVLAFAPKNPKRTP